jgi:hypothetical protein
LFYERKNSVCKDKYALMCDFGILSRGHALTKSGILSDESKNRCKNLHKYVKISYLHCLIKEEIVFAMTNMLLCVILAFCPGEYSKELIFCCRSMSPGQE